MYPSDRNRVNIVIEDQYFFIEVLPFMTSKVSLDIWYIFFWIVAVEMTFHENCESFFSINWRESLISEQCYHSSQSINFQFYHFKYITKCRAVAPSWGMLTKKLAVLILFFCQICILDCKSDINQSCNEDSSKTLGRDN